MKLISLFSGIGGFELAGEWAGWQNVVSCEINPFGRKVLEYYWPNAYHHDDIKTLTFEKIDYELTQRFGAKWNADDIILTGGFPCQPYSAAGKRLGKEDERHLFPEMLRIIREVQPKWVVGENVLGLVNWSGGLVFEEVQADLESEGYEIQPYVLPASSVNAPHKRDRVWFVAYRNAPDTDNVRLQQCKTPGTLGKGQEEICGQGHKPSMRIKTNECFGNSTDTESRGQRRLRNEGEETGTRQSNNPLGSVCGIPNWDNFPTTEPTIRTGNDGLPTELDGITFSKWRNESIKAGGNAIVPQVVYQIFKAINEYQTNIQKP
jgi:DNA (cytosine-5)-methyltransferase 1